MNRQKRWNKGISHYYLRRLLAYLCGYSLVWGILFCVIKYISTDMAYPIEGGYNKPAALISVYAFEVMTGLWFCTVIGILLYHWKQILSALEAQAAQSQQKKNEMLACLAHDLRTPLTSILGYAHLMNDAADLNTPESRNSVRVILNKSRLLSGMLDEFFEITRLETGNERFEPQEINLAEMLRQLVSEYAPLLEQAGLGLRCEVAPACAVAACDPALMERAFDNLMRNAMKYAPAGTEICVSGGLESERFHICFDNASEAITKAQLDGMFEAFVRLETARDRVEGAGMGLTIHRARNYRAARRRGSRGICRWPSANSSVAEYHEIIMNSGENPQKPPRIFCYTPD